MRLVNGDPHRCHFGKARQDRIGNRTGGGLDQPIALGAESPARDLDDLVIADRVGELVGMRGGREINVEDVGPAIARERPDVALVGLGESSEHALRLIEKIVHEAACPVIVLLHAANPEFVSEAAKRGVFAYITDAEGADWQSSIDIVLRRFAEYQALEGAFGRRAVTERAKGILMERHSVDETAAFEMLREHARSTNWKLVDVASAVVEGHRLLPKRRASLSTQALTSLFALCRFSFSGV